LRNFYFLIDNTLSLSLEHPPVIVTAAAIMSSAVAELDAYLQSMLNLKPPGVSGSKITSITSLCTANIQVRALTPKPLPSSR
jgi:hypothetical protein